MSADLMCDARLMAQFESGFKGDEYIDWLAESLLQIPSMDSEELNLNVPTFHAHDNLISTGSEHHQDASQFDDSFNSWLRSLLDEESGEFGEITMRPALMLSPHIIRAPLRSVRSDKHALRSE
jgi:hypothetical protein